MKVSGIILDVDGTIWDSTGVVADAWNVAITKSGYDIPFVTKESLQSQFGKTMDVIADNLFPNLEQSQKQILLQECQKQEHIFLSKNQTDISYPLVAESIKTISKNIPCYIVSNCQKGYIELVMQKLSITEYISDFECFGNNGFSKDKNIQLIIKRNNILHPIYVGDTQVDKDACKKANVPFVFATYGFGNNVESLYTIKTFSDLKKLVIENE